MTKPEKKFKIGENEESEANDVLVELETLRKDGSRMLQLGQIAHNKLSRKYNGREIPIEWSDVIELVSRRFYYGSMADADEDKNGISYETKKEETGYITRNRKKYREIFYQMIENMDNAIRDLTKDDKTYDTYQLDHEINENLLRNELPKITDKAENREGYKKEHERNLCEVYIKQKGKKHDIDIFKLMTQGIKNNEIAKRLKIDKKTVENRKERIMINLKERFKDLDIDKELMDTEKHNESYGYGDF